jgi:hypothetical protein
MFGHILLHLLDEKRRQFSMMQSEDADVLNESHLAKHSVMIRGINPDLGPEHVEKIMRDVLMKEYPDMIADCHALGKFQKLNHMLIKHNRCILKTDFYILEHQREDGHTYMRKEKTYCGTKETSIPNYWHYQIKTLDLKKKMKRDRELNEARNFGIAFITLFKFT